MLTSLRIENFAIVSEITLEFSQGMSAFTGETGAGKSIMIDALMLALGERSDASVVRLGAEKCDITACFHIDSHSPPAEWLAEHDIACEAGELIMRRVIFAEGRSKSYINAQPFPVQKIKELSVMLVDIHGQHQHQTLLQHATHRQQLDQYANHQTLLSTVQHNHQACQKLRHELQDLTKNTPDASEAAALLDQIQELEDLNVQDGEIQALHQEHQILHNACAYLEHTQHIHDLLYGDEEAPNICHSLHQILQRLSALPDQNPHIKTATELLQNALIHCEEARDEITHFGEQVSLDPERLQQVEERMSQLHQAARKYHIDVQRITHHTNDLREQLQQRQTIEETQRLLQKQYDEHLQNYQEAALALRASRQQYAPKLEADITHCIHQLGMPKGYLKIRITPLETMQAHGMDKVEYQVCTNPGMAPDALAKIASGGELSRIGLAIRMITAQRATTPTLLFDEVDVGIGGSTAALVGQLLRNLGERMQVFCVTHQPQVASCAHHHFMVEKHSDDTQTFSKVTALDHAEKISEIARMLGGLTITDQTLLHAKELLTQGVK